MKTSENTGSFKKLISFILALVMLLSCLVSCGGTGTPPDDGTVPDTDAPEDDGGDKNKTEDTDAEKTYFTSLIYAADNPSSVDYRAMVNKNQAVSGKRIPVKCDETSETEANEIVVGRTNRQITSSCERAISIYKSENTVGIFDVPYAIVKRNGSIGVVWEHDTVAGEVMNIFLEKLADENYSTEGSLEIVGTVRVGGKLEAQEDAAREQALKAVGEELGLEALQAIRAHLSIFTEDYYIWLANLYEPRTCICDNYDEDGYRVCLLPKDAAGNYLCYGGGFYYCNSARDTAGYYIDIESTAQAIRFLTNSGMMKRIRDLDRQIQLDIIAFAKSLQSSEDGYFYHPQWGSGITVSRKGRDLGWATSMITEFGGKPIWDAPNGIDGERGAPGASKTALTAKLGTSVANSVSKITLSAVWPDHLKTVSAFLEYLDSFDLATNSYSAGNTFNAQQTQIINRDKEGLASGEFIDADGNGIADDGFIAAFERHFNEAQNPENGLWQDTVCYYSVNGLMKIASCYNKFGIRLPYPEQAFESASAMARLPVDESDVNGAQPKGSVSVYNPWVAISAVLSNVGKFAGAEQRETLREMLRASAAEMIRVTTEKAKKFAKADGSFGYTWTTPPYHSQGAPVCPKGIIEGDINGGNIATNGIWSNMTSALGISMKIFDYSDGERFKFLLSDPKPTKTKYDLSN